MIGPERWAEIERLFHAALDRDEQGRAAFLLETCGHDDALRREIDSLLAYAPAAGSPTLSPTVHALDRAVIGSVRLASPALRGGARFGSYTIIELIGAGGTGEVYRAHDVTLGRDVALKVLPLHVARDAEQRRRVLREARAAASLNHPNICTIHEVGDADGYTYIAMEAVEGRSLAARLAEGPLSVPDLLRCGVQLADAASHAHERRILHRDLKSANVMLTREGRVKVLDFGLAKRISTSEVDAQHSRVPNTELGGVFGTVPYMSPEQLRGLPADTRSDVWAMGVIVYELAAGRRPFAGQTNFDVSSAILHDRPAPLPSHIPSALQAAIGRCLEKEPERRFQQASDLRAALESLENVQVRSAVRAEGMRRRVATLYAGAATIVVAVVAVLMWSRSASFRQLMPGSTGTPVQSIAVLPLKSVSGNPGDAYVVDGMHDALITDLARLGVPRVIAKTSADAFKGSTQSLRDIGKQLGVDGLVTGSVMRVDQRVQITVQLVKAVTGDVVWANRYERSTGDILSLQSDLVEAIAREIHATISPEQTARLSTARQVNPAAHDAYLKGRSMEAAFANFVDRPHLDAAVAQYEEAIRLDPSYAPPYAALSVMFQNASQASLLPPADTLPRARAAARKAVDLDDLLPEGHAALAGVLLWHDWNWAAADREIRRALQLNPQSADVLHLAEAYAALVSASVDDVSRFSQRILDVDPLNPFSRVQTVWSAFNTQRYDEAIRRAKALLDVWPDNIMGPWFLASSYAVQRNRAEVAANCGRVMKLLGGAYNMQAIAMCAWAYATVGQANEARRLLNIVEHPPSGAWLDPAVMGNAYGPLDPDRAFAWYDKALADRSPNLVYMKVAAPWDATRSDPRFESLLRRMNFPK
jgi:serine/threonine-protein kinase